MSDLIGEVPTTVNWAGHDLPQYRIICARCSFLMASRKTLNRRPRPQRATSNVFAMFDQAQIQEFKEAFNMIDQNRDGFIDVQDLQDMFASLGSLTVCYTRIVGKLHLH
ncbi:putative myosin regulatory light chain [Dirofilaria immitis]|nr:putative myosin regulatory light chain [Dirofilaria immitis]